MSKNAKKRIAFLIAVFAALVIWMAIPPSKDGYPAEKKPENITAENISQVQSAAGEYEGVAYAVVNNNEPFFDINDYSADSFEKYGELDELGRCTYAFACIGKDIMPTGERGSISHIYPTGWKQKRYDFVESKNLYNRCHLVGYQLSGENANRKNLITGTRYLNNEGMLPFENMIADYVKESENHVLYRVTPLFEEDNLVANGVLMEAKSVEDDGESICFNVYCYNVQPGVAINYATGESRKE